MNAPRCPRCDRLAYPDEASCPHCGYVEPDLEPMAAQEVPRVAETGTSSPAASSPGPASPGPAAPPVYGIGEKKRRELIELLTHTPSNRIGAVMLAIFDRPIEHTFEDAGDLEHYPNVAVEGFGPRPLRLAVSESLVMQAEALRVIGGGTDTTKLH